MAIFEPEPPKILSAALSSNSITVAHLCLLTKSIINTDEFLIFLSKIPKNVANNRLFLARVDEFPIGLPYKELNQWDLALENGIIQGLLNSGFKIAD